ncbi:MAG TPA: hypothetical protein VK858_11735 [Longimicrobiales bacterium]|nr:hypothetical protein [Longimicrobiales bacterium]
MSTAQAVVPTEDTRTVRQALRRMKGTATVGDVSSATGLPQARAEDALKTLLEMHRGHLAVGERGDLVYRFDPGMIRRDAVPFLTRLRENAWSIFKTTFKVVIAVVLVVYAVIFLALMIAALLANRDGDGDFGGGGDRRGGGGHFPSFWLWYWLWSPRWGWGRPYYGDYYGRQGARRRGERPQGPPFYKKVFAFVFGPDEPELTPERRDRELLRFIRARQGAVSAADLVQATGMTLEDAESELGRLMVAHDGEVEVTDDGTLVYLFPALMVSAGGPVRDGNLPAAWRRLEPPAPLTGNSAGSNVAIVGLNAFNLAAAATAPWFIFPRLGIGGTAAEVGLIWIPVVFSALFFAVPALRIPGVLRENARRASRNVRKTLLSLVSRSALQGNDAGSVSLKDAEALVHDTLDDKRHRRVDVSGTLDRLVAEFDGEVEVEPDGDTRFRFPGFRTAMAAAHKLRRAVGLDKRVVGRVVYASDDDAATASERDLATFDEALASETSDTLVGDGSSAPEDEPLALPPADALQDYLNDPDRLAFRDERELAALEDEMRQEAAGAGAR